MSKSELRESGEAQAPMVIAFYLPQFHPSAENDAWRGRGFTDWRSTVQARPLFPGHYQPHIPGELGFYDLRLPEVRAQQSHLALSHGISGFCYYHYWFKGRRVLNRPFDEVRSSGRPEIPFCLCWVNENWYRKWRSAGDDLLLEQEYSNADDLEHIRWLIEAFRDSRYIKVDGRPLLCVYRVQSMPNPKATFDMWRSQCVRAGIPEPWIVKFETWGDTSDPESFGCDASAEFIPHGIERYVRPLPPRGDCAPGNTIYDYAEVAEVMAGRLADKWRRYPCVATGWDNTPRRSDGDALVLDGAEPAAYGAWLDRAMAAEQRRGEGGIVFVNAWNEWAEGAHLEPDLKTGRGFLEATKSVASKYGKAVGASPSSVHDNAEEVPLERRYSDLYERYLSLLAASGDIGAMKRRRNS